MKQSISYDQTDSSRTIIFDIETGPLPMGELAVMLPKFEAPANYKDPAKIAAYEEEKRQAWIADSALSPLTGRVLAIGWMFAADTTDAVQIEGNDDEAATLKAFWDILFAHRTMHITKIVGFNSHSFDLPFLIKRSWKYGLSIPPLKDGRWWNDLYTIDLRERWQLGDKTAPGSLDSIAKFFGLEGKKGSGADFATVWAKDREAAKLYLAHDLRLTNELWKRLGP